MPDKHYDQIVCLVGENPLPVYLGIKQFTDSNSMVGLVHSAETAKQAKSIEAICRKKLNLNDVRLECLHHPFEPLKVMKQMHEIRGRFPASALNYTGGTKVMSGFGLFSWSIKLEGGISLLDRVFYLEEQSGYFHFGTQAEGIELTVPLSLDELRELHGVGRPNAQGATRLSPKDLTSIFSHWPRSHTMFGGTPKKRDFDAMKDSPTSDWNRFLDMLTPNTKERWLAELGSKPNRWYGKAACAAGLWFEQLVETLIRCQYADGTSVGFEEKLNQDKPPLFPEREIFANQHFPVACEDFGTSLEFETDLLVVYNHQLRYISVTTSRDERRCKDKAFQAMYRARQIGGGMASSCVVCLGESEVRDIEGRARPFAVAIEASLGNDRRHKVFGREDVEDWMAEQTRSLREFLTE